MSPTVSAQDEVTELLVELIRFNTSNPTHPERPAAEWVAEKLDEVGVESEIFESEPGRASVVARLEGSDRDRAPLLIHGHLDVVPADASEWSVDPFAGEVKDDYVWGRGAIDMKDMDAMTLALVREYRRTGRKPARDVVLAFVADEEAGGRKGAHHLVDHHADLFADCTEAISEVGGYSISLNDQARAYAIQTAEKGIHWLRLRARSRPGHGSMVHEENAVTRLAEAVSRIGNHEWPIVVTDTVRALVEGLAETLGRDLDPERPDEWLPVIGGAARMIGATVRNTANPTMLQAGYKTNVIPGSAEATIDCRFLPGQEDELLATIDELLGEHVERETEVRDIAVETGFDGHLVEVMAAALKAEDPIAVPLPYLMSGGTDAKSFSTLGMRCFGFSPLLLPADLDFTALFHGIDERVPVDGLKFGVRVLDRLLQDC
ncbi:Acetylornithine deacetylase/Succinyl-diaminopimelate desuccinylase [Jatrophihabitans endophyticus]|uniref:Acetylornithine deacetylase/Succinyl-diaminopimelate desuccinylase n=1 Tax=Jatrophihabitans endophyticus TaxID=1206085 RepID=A0A1M5BY06_9ACTN|nr:M20/M25/M40 family metallo-hydrolase [Jatrophihabitans endophyticus]SHF47227.1 Acetylornithine deacetylase/Succinyl-diaminopimelate desuccinylase [Jatrophihabitans endophyticus]